MVAEEAVAAAEATAEAERSVHLVFLIRFTRKLIWPRIRKQIVKGIKREDR